MSIASTLLALCLAGAPAYAQDPEPTPEAAESIVGCPEGYTCLPDAQYATVYAKLEELAQIEEGVPTVSFEAPLVVVTDDQGRVFSNSTGDQLIPGTVEWGHMSADLKLVVDVDVRQKETPQAGFRARPKASFGVIPLAFRIEDPAQMVDVGLGLDFLYFRKYNLNAYLGSRSFGVDVGFDVFQNSGVMAGAHWTWPSAGTPPAITPGVYWYFAF
jgi:hypothetical protein